MTSILTLLVGGILGALVVTMRVVKTLAARMTELERAIDVLITLNKPINRPRDGAAQP